MKARSAAWWTILAALFLWLLPGRLPAAEPPRAPVVVTIVVDQLAAWIASERLPLLPPTGGFARLLREGLWVRDLRYAHAVTDTGPGHAALYTGAPPRGSGIFGNEVPPLAACHAPPASSGTAKPEAGGAFDDPDSILLEPKVASVPPDERPGPTCGVSLRALRAETLADRLRATHPEAIIVSLSLKDRGATIGGGRRPTASLWFDLRRGRFVTSTAFRRDLPPWIEGVNRWLEESLRAGLVWEPEDAAWVAAHAGTPDDQPGEGGSYGTDAKLGSAGLGRRFPHRILSPRTLRISPFGDEALFRAAVAALGSEEVGRRPTLLALSLSAHDSIGHLFGPDSWEAWDELHRLDGMLGRFLEELDRRLGERGYAVVLAADHGSIHMPEACGGAGQGLGMGMDRWQRPCKSDGHRLLQDRPTGRPMRDAVPGEVNVELVELLERLAAEVPGGKREWIRGMADPYVYLSAEARAKDNRRRLLEHLQSRRLPGVRRVVDPLALGPCPPVLASGTDESEEALVCRSVVPGAGGDFYLVPEPGSFFDPRLERGCGSSHGSPYLYDRAVPLLVRAPGRAKPRVVEGPVPYSAFTRTVAALLGITPPRDAAPAPELLEGR
jgi:hypothetical protein